MITDDTAAVLAGHTALVTGATRGLGRAIAIELARAGATVAVGARSGAGGHEVVNEISAFGGEALVVELDVFDLDQARAAVDSVIEQVDHLDILVNNAGGGIMADAIDVTEADFDHVMDFNLKSTFFISQHFARRTDTARPSSIVNIASQAGLVALPGESAYCISKAGVVHLTRCLAVEWGPIGIRVNAVAPTFIETDGTAEALSDPEFRADTLERIAALHRIGVPREVSGAVAFLASPAASLITGQTLAIDGGWTAR